MYLQITKVHGTENEDWCNDAFYLSGLKTYWCQTLTEHQYWNHGYYLPVHLTLSNSSMLDCNCVLKTLLRITTCLFKLGIFLLINQKLKCFKVLTDIYNVSLETCNSQVANMTAISNKNLSSPICAEYPSQMTQYFASYYMLMRPIVNMYLQITKVHGTEELREWRLV